MVMRTIVAVELRYSSARTVLIRPVIHITPCYAIRALMVVMIAENQKVGLTEAMDHPPEDVVAAVGVVDEEVVVVTKTLDKVTTNKTTLNHNHHAQMAVARISDVIISRRVP